MKLEKVREEINYFSQKASEASQKLALAGIAVIWLFKSTDEGITSFHWLLYWSLMCFIATLFIEFIHYLIFAPIWANYYTKKYGEIKASKQPHAGGQETKRADIESEEVEQPSAENKFGWWLFGLKAITLLVGYGFFMVYMWDAVKITS